LKLTRIPVQDNEWQNLFFQRSELHITDNKRIEAARIHFQTSAEALTPQTQKQSEHIKDERPIKKTDRSKGF
jgi:hypothetical protein